VLLLLREHDLAVADDVELALAAGPDRCVVSLLVQLGRETRGPSVVAASDRAIQDLDAHAGSVRGRSDLMEGAIVQAAEGDVDAAEHAQATAQDLIERVRG
jgi:hypothetical protein